MSFEGTTNPVAEETVVSSTPEVEVAASPEAQVTENPDTDENGDQVSDPAPVDDTEEVEYEGQKVRVPKAVKEALLRHADYTRKTQELAEQRRTFAATVQGATTAQQEYVDALALVKTYDGYLNNYANRTDADWTNLEMQDPARAQREWRHFSQLTSGRAQADEAAKGTKQRLAVEADRARDNRVQEVKAELQKILPEWAPDNEFEKQLAKYGAANHVSASDMAEATLRNPNVLKLFDKARRWDEHQAKEAATKKVAAQQAVKPAAEIGSRSATATKDPAQMSQAQYVKWREAQDKARA